MARKKEGFTGAVSRFQKAHPTKASKEKALRSMTNAQIDSLINDSSNIQEKIFYSSFKKNNAGKVNK